MIFEIKKYFSFSKLLRFKNIQNDLVWFSYEPTSIRDHFMPNWSWNLTLLEIWSTKINGKFRNFFNSKFRVENCAVSSSVFGNRNIFLGWREFWWILNYWQKCFVDQIYAFIKMNVTCFYILIHFLQYLPTHHLTSD